MGGDLGLDGMKPGGPHAPTPHPPSRAGDAAFRVGDHVAVRDASNVLKKAVVAPVPRAERDRSGSDVITTHGTFRKTWVSVEGRPPVPWPTDDVFTDIEAAKEAQRAHA